MSPTLNGAAYIADFLIQQKVPYIFGLCGHGNLGLLDGLYDRKDEITTISVHHEAVAAFMAEACSRPGAMPPWASRWRVRSARSSRRPTGRW
jgi:acetolactate synthase-1/2/3 large subunit